MGMYLNGQKIGYTSLRTEPTTYHGKPALLSLSGSVTKMTLLGSSVQQEEISHTITDLAYRPLSQVFDVKSNGSVLHVEADYDYTENKVACRVGVGAQATTKTLTIPPGANLTGDVNGLPGGQKLTVGQKITTLQFDPLTVALLPVAIQVMSRETVRDALSGKDTPALVVKANMSLGQMTTWESEDGDLLKADIGMGFVHITMQREARAKALAFPDSAASQDATGYAPPTDFAIVTAIKTDRPIDNPRRVRALRVSIVGVPDRRLLLSDDRQRETLPAPDILPPYATDVQISAAPFDPAKSALASPDIARNPDLSPFLGKAAFLDTENPEIVETAAKLRGGETRLYSIAVNIRDWVHRSMTPDPSIGVPRAATDIFARRRGVCRDYATLYTALARAAGVPTRLCSGIVYAEGRFFYHAWAESWVGRWLSFDPTLYDPAQKADFVDATHIKFAQGDVTSMFAVVAIIGKLQITVQDFTL